VSTVSELGRLGTGHDFVSIQENPDVKPTAHVLVLRPDEPLFFANVERILLQSRQLIAAAGPSVTSVVLSLEESFDLDSTSLEALLVFFDWTANQGQRLVLARLKHPVHLLLDQVAKPRLHAPACIGLSVDEAVQIAQRPPAPR
jgi:MFS superfamily sulfate permease-like transporter